jgi:protein-tyrosine phosphatase
MTKPDPNTYWVLAGKLLAGEYPGHVSRAQARVKLRAFLNAGIRHFVDLTEPDELEAYQALLTVEAQSLRVAVTYARIPIRDYSVPQRPDVMHRILDTINANVERDGITYLHCWGGIGRTGLVVACWLQEQGRTADEALAELARLWQTNQKSKRRPSSPETAAQLAWVRHWHRHRQRVLSNG